MPLSTWLRIVDIFHGGVAATRLATLIDVCYETAFQAAHRIRVALLPHAPLLPQAGTADVTWGVVGHKTRLPWLRKPNNRAPIAAFYVGEQFVAYGLRRDRVANLLIRNRHAEPGPATDRVRALDEVLKARHGAVSRRWLRAYLAEHATRSDPKALLRSLLTCPKYAFDRLPDEPGKFRENLPYKPPKEPGCRTV